MPPPLDRRATPYPVDPSITLAEFEARIAAEPDEVAAAFGVTGRLMLLPRRGIPNKVRFYENEVTLLQDAIVTHGHPLGGVLSGADTQFASDNDVVEMRAVLPNGVLYVLPRPPGGWPDGDQIFEATEQCLRTAVEEDETRTRFGKPIMNADEYDRLMFREQRDALRMIGVTIIKGGWR